MSDLKEKIKKIDREFALIKESLNVGGNEKRVRELEAESANPEFWKDKEGAKKLMQELGDLKSQKDKILEGEKIIQDAKAALELGMGSELQKSVKKAEELVSELKQATFLSGRYDRRSAIISIHAGQGGVEAMDWVSMLYRMYLKYLEKRGWSWDVYDLSEGEEAGIKSVTFKAEGVYAYGYLKNESGTHRLVRKSPFNADQKRETSFALVEVLPELEEVDLPDIKISEDELEWQFFRASTQGGQNVQKVSTAVRVKHKPTGISVTSQAERSQVQNRKIAMDLLRSKLWIREQEKSEEVKKKLKGEYKPASWGNQIRSYVVHPYKMVKDLRTKVEVADAESVLDGNIDMFIEEELKLS